MTSPASRLEREQHQVSWNLALLLTCLLTGYVTWVWGIEAAALQSAVLLHAISGVLLTPFLLLYLWNHFRRTLGMRRAGVLFSGLLSALLILPGIGSGAYLVVYGVAETTAWILQLHIVSVSVSLLLGLAHLLLHLLGYDARRRQRQESPWPSVERIRKPVLALYVFAPLVLCLALAAVIRGSDGSVSGDATSPVVANYSYPYGDHPFRPSQTETASGGFISEREIARSEDCAECHADIADQWAQSVHRHAADDPTYVTNINLLSENKGIEATRYCEGCHAPVALLTGQLSPGGAHGGIVGTAANREGVGCLACHNIDKIMHTQGVASFRYGPPSQYLFEASGGAVATALRHWLMRMNPSLHRQEMARPVLSTPELCASCHAQFMDKDLNHWGWVKMQDDYSAWRNGPFSGHNTEEFGSQAMQTCNNCHMAAVAAQDPSADDSGRVASHFYPAANTVVARHFGHDEQVARTRDFLRGNKMSLSIEQPNRTDATQTLQAMQEQLRTQSEAPAFYYLGETANISVVVGNRSVGHNFPGGSIDINEAWLAFTVTDGAGELVYTSGAITGDEFAPLAVDPGAYFYRSLPVDRRGNLVWQHDLFNRVGEAEKRVIPAGKSDLVSYAFKIPDWVKTPLTITATLNYRKLNDRYARWALGADYAPVPIVDMARDTIQVPVYLRDSVVAD